MTNQSGLKRYGTETTLRGISAFKAYNNLGVICSFINFMMRSRRLYTTLEHFSLSPEV